MCWFYDSVSNYLMFYKTNRDSYTGTVLYSGVHVSYTMPPVDNYRRLDKRHLISRQQHYSATFDKSIQE